MGNNYPEYLEIYNKAVKKAAVEYAKAYVHNKENPLDGMVFPIWRDGVHV